MTALSRLDRARSGEPQNLPRPTEDADVVTVDTTWGVLQPLQPVPGIRTVGELEVADLVEEGAQLVDTRVPDSRSGTSLPGCAFAKSEGANVTHLLVQLGPTLPVVA